MNLKLESIMDKGHPLPWPELKLPPYTEVKLGGWHIFENTPPLLRGYFRGLQPMIHKNWVLKRDDELWMSTTPMELESAIHHAANATGHTVIMGLGLGVLLYNVLQRDEVTKVTVVELDPKVFDLLDRSAGIGLWPGHEKLEMVIADAFDYVPTEPVDVLLVDIWLNLGDMQLRPDAQKLFNKVNPTNMGVWGIEADYISWMNEQGFEPGDESSDTFTQYAIDIGVPLIERDNDEYARLALEAARNMFLS
jgi:hypothetical protein